MIKLAPDQIKLLKRYIKEKRLSDAIALIETGAGHRASQEKILEYLAAWQRLLQFEEGAEIPSLPSQECPNKSSLGIISC